MIVNKKKAIRLKNNTKYFTPEYCKTHNTFGSPESYQSRRIKIEGYESRLYWQYRYCDEHNGQTYFYTLTYSDENIPKYYGQNCFDYEHLRDLFTGGFRKRLLRTYGTTFKYFVGAELGDGKGERGMHNNPHYHVLFFLEDAHNERYPYKKILPEQFRHLVRKYWQGFDEDTDGAHDYRTCCKYGIVKEGEHLGLVTDFRACMYCAKYCAKDVKLRMHESEVARKLTFKYKQDMKYEPVLQKKFFYEVLYPMFNIPRNAKHTEWTFTPKEFISYVMGEPYQLWLFPDWLADDDGDDIDYYQTNHDIIVAKNLWKEYTDFLRREREDKVRLALNEYRNRYCNKTRISHGVGDYALQFMDLENPTVQIPSKKGFKSRPLSMYYYRKLFTDVVVDKKGSPIRYLNDLGIEYKCSRLDKQIKKVADRAAGSIDIITGNRDLFNKIKESDVNTKIFFSYDDFLRDMNYLLNENNIENILTRYGEYKTVYEDRYFKFNYEGEGEFGVFPNINVSADYRKFLSPTVFITHRSDTLCNTFIERTPEDWCAYYSHPYFLRYVRLFDLLDIVADYFFIQGDNKAQAEAEERAATKRFHDRKKVKEFYAHFGL